MAPGLIDTGKAEPITTDISLQPSSSSESWLSALKPVPTDEIFMLLGEYLEDPQPEKVNLSVGVYRTDEAKPWVLSSVDKAEDQLVQERSQARHEYLPIAGDQKFLQLARDLSLGFNKSTPEADKARTVSVQTISGSGANHVAAVFLTRYLKPKNIWISNPTWGNHHAIWEFAGPNVKQRFYPYYDHKTRSLDFDGMVETLERDAHEGDAILLQACAHNPTGLDPTKEQWKTIADICERKRIFPLFDMAYQGFASGSVSEDSWAIRYFFTEKPNLDMFICQSFSKNFGLYGQRVGALHFVLRDPKPESKAAVFTHLCNIIRGEYSMAPSGGAAIVRTILADAKLTALWHDDLDVMSDRIRTSRRLLYDELVKLNTPGTWEHIVNQACLLLYHIITDVRLIRLLKQNGMFSYVGLTPEQVSFVKDEYHVYMLQSARASISGRMCSALPPLLSFSPSFRLTKIRSQPKQRRSRCQSNRCSG